MPTQQQHEYQWSAKTRVSVKFAQPPPTSGRCAGSAAEGAAVERP